MKNKVISAFVLIYAILSTNNANAVDINKLQQDLATAVFVHCVNTASYSAFIASECHGNEETIPACAHPARTLFLIYGMGIVYFCLNIALECVKNRYPEH